MNRAFSEKVIMACRMHIAVMVTAVLYEGVEVGSFGGASPEARGKKMIHRTSLW